MGSNTLKLWIKTLLRFAAGAYFVLTSLYCILAFLPYTFYFLIKAPAYSWMPWFVHHHAALYWTTVLALLAANWNTHPRPSYRQWRLLAMVGFFLVSEIYLSIHPFLALLQNDGAAYYWSLASLLPLVLAMVFSRIELGFSHHSRSITARPFQYSGALLSAARSGDRDAFLACCRVGAASPWSAWAGRCALLARAGEPTLDALPAGERPSLRPPSPKLPSYIPSIDLEGAPSTDLNRYLVADL